MELIELRPRSRCPSRAPVVSQVHAFHSHPIYLRFILTLSALQYQGLPNWLFPCGFLTKNLNAFLFCPVESHLILRDLIARITLLL